MKQCEICGKGYLKGNKRSHSKKATIKRQQPNLQKTTVKGKKVTACAKCIKAQSKTK